MGHSDEDKPQRERYLEIDTGARGARGEVAGVPGGVWGGGWRGGVVSLTFHIVRLVGRGIGGGDDSVHGGDGALGEWRQ